MGILRDIKYSLNKKSVVRNVLFCLAIILLMRLLYGVYRSSAVLQEGKRGNKGKYKNNPALKMKLCNKGDRDIGKLTKKLEGATKRKQIKKFKKKNQENPEKNEKGRMSN